MSWFKLAVAALTLLLAGCGFRPLHGQAEAPAAMAGPLSRIEVDFIDNRIGQLLRNQLLNRLSPAGTPADPRYRLKVTLALSQINMGLRADGSATRSRKTVTAAYALSQDATLVTSGTSRFFLDFDVVEARYAAVVAERDAEGQAVEVIADDIATRLALFFARTPPP